MEIAPASARLLAYVSGIGETLARNIVAFRAEHGPLRSRRDLLKVPRLGPKAFEQAAGFLRIGGDDNPLDASAVHPESYDVVERMAGDLGVDVANLVGRSIWCAAATSRATWTSGASSPRCATSSPS